MQVARRFCRIPTCPDLAVPGERYCAAHARARQQQQPSAAARGYDRVWSAFSQRWLAEFPWCGQRVDGTLYAEHSRCVQTATRTRATVTDHIVSKAQGGAHLSRRNSQSLCGACNRRKCIALEGGFSAVR